MRINKKKLRNDIFYDSLWNITLIVQNAVNAQNPTIKIEFKGICVTEKSEEILHIAHDHNKSIDKACQISPRTFAQQAKQNGSKYIQ